MKKVASIFIFLFFSFSLFSNPLQWNNKTSLYDHLVEVNKEWLKISADDFLCQDVFFKNDKERIQKHLQLVEQHLRQNPPNSLSSDQLKNRTTALDILNNYWRAGIFPKNTFHQTRQPYFIDRFGTACAVGYLALQTGESMLVEQISREMNYGYVAELKDSYPELLDWAEEYGFTADELAWIQPTYSPPEKRWYKMGNGGGVDGHINTMKSRYSNSDFLYIAGDFTEIDGFMANSIVAWNGNDWLALGAGVTGEIFDIYISSGERVYIAGDFYLNDNPDIADVAYWQYGEWHSVTDQHIDGAVFSIFDHGTLYIGGDFTIATDSGIIENIAYLKSSDSLWRNADGAFSVNGIVTDFLWHDNLLVAGHFTETGTLTTDTSINHLEVNGLAYWEPGNSVIPTNWDFGFTPIIQNIGTIAIEDGWLFVGSDSFDMDYFYPNIAKLSAGIWDYLFYQPFNFESPSVMGFVTYEDVLFAYGNLGAFSGVISTGFVPLVGGGIIYRTEINDVVRAAESFQGHLYVAGDFTQIFDKEYNGLAYTAFELLTPTEEPKPKNNIDVFASTSQIHVQYESLNENVEFSVYNLNGQLVEQTKLSQGSAEISISTQDWASGMYVFQIVGKETQQSGKLIVY
jgi:Secretion system C-terminal sorting domain